MSGRAAGGNFQVVGRPPPLLLRPSLPAPPSIRTNNLHAGMNKRTDVQTLLNQLACPDLTAMSATRPDPTPASRLPETCSLAHVFAVQ